MRILTFGMLYPDSTRPQYGVFVETRLRQLLDRGGVEARVVAPVPWFPSKRAAFGAWASFAAVPGREVRHGIAVEHPRFISIPKVGMSIAPITLAAGALPALQRIRREGFDFDVIDAQYFYPDGVAAIWMGRHLRCPVTITARGSDINVIARFALPRRMIVKAAPRAAGIITVCAALKDALVALGVPPSSVTVLPNGVDLGVFAPPADRPELRRTLGMSRRTLLAVGNLVDLKGHHLTIEALRELPEFDLVIAGAGPEEARLRELARRLGVADRTRLLGRVDQFRLVQWYGAADALVLASASEGLANVLLESMACGTPVIATSVGGTPEVVVAPEAGVLIVERTPASIAAAVRRLFDNLPDRGTTRRYAGRFSWDDTADRLRSLFAGITSKR